MALVRLRISGEPRNITVHAFLSAVDNWLRVLADLDSAISGASQGSLEWFISDLSTGSLAVEIESKSRLEERNYGPEVADAFMTGVMTIEREGTSPPYLSEVGMQKLQRLLRLIGREGTSGLVVSDSTRSVEVSARASANIDPLIRVQERSIGSVEGKIETISIHGKPRFIVYHGMTRKAVTCKFDPDRWLDELKDALGRRVSVSGLVHYNAKREPVRVDIESISPLRRSEELPTTSEMSGSDADFTGEMTTADFIRRVRGG